MNNRDEWLARTFVELADTLVADFDLIDFLSVLAERSVELLDAAEVGLIVTDTQGQLRVIGSSTERMRITELFEVQNEEGPCLDCFRNGEAIVNQPLHRNMVRWPRFASLALENGFQMVHALPLRLRSDVIGAMNVFGGTLSEISPEDVNLTQALADAATIGILQERAVRRVTDLSVQLQGALNSRIVVEQAKGIVAERLQVEMDRAFGMLRDYARRNRIQLSVVASALISGSLPPMELLSDSTSSIRVKRESESG